MMKRRTAAQLLLLIAICFQTNAQPSRHLRRPIETTAEDEPSKKARKANPLPPNVDALLHHPRDLQFDDPFDYETRVVGGTKVSDKSKHPYFAEWRHQYCGAVLIHDDLVLSAAHCDDGGSFSNELYFQTVSRSEQGVVREIADHRAHPNYNGKVSTRDYDYLLLKLETSALVDDNGKPTGAEILPINTDPTVPRANDPLWGIGYGAVDEDDNRAMSPTLQEATVQTFANDTCQKQYGQYFVKDYMFCSGVEGGGTDTCRGDSGGPMVHQKTGTLVGLVSFGIGCARHNFFGVNSRVSFVGDWLLDSMCEWSDYPKCNGRYVNGATTGLGKAGFTGVERARFDSADSVSVSMEYRFRLIDYRFRLIENPTMEAVDNGQGEPSQEEWDGLNEAMRNFWIEAMTAQYLDNPKTSFVIVDAKWELDSTNYDPLQEFPYSGRLLTDVVFTEESTIPSSEVMKSDMKSTLQIAKNDLRNSYVRKATPEDSMFRDTLEIEWE